MIFQDGRLQGPLGYTSFGGIIWYVPLLIQAVLALRAVTGEAGSHGQAVNAARLADLGPPGPVPRPSPRTRR